MIINQVIRKIKRKLKSFLPAYRPDFMILGAQKAGTSSLHYYLSQQPSLSGSFPKEVGYFNQDYYFEKKLEDYEKHFRGWGDKKYFESTPEYFYTPDTHKIIHDLYPDLNFIVLLRDPIKRAYSSWNMYKDIFEKNQVNDLIKSIPPRKGNLLYKELYEGREAFPSFRECIDIELDLIKSGKGYEPSFLRRGLYLDQLNDYWNSFGKDKILILGFNDFVKDTENTLKKVTGFLGVPDVKWSDLKKEPLNARSYTEPIKESDKEFLEEFYRQPNKELFETIGHINW